MCVVLLMCMEGELCCATWLLLSMADMADLVVLY